MWRVDPRLSYTPRRLNEFLLAIGMVILTCSSMAVAVEPEFVGTLALLATEKSAQELGLTEQQQDEVMKLIDERETEALELALELKDQPPEEQEKKLAPFRLESQRLGFGLLNSKQRAGFTRIIVRNLGPEHLIEGSLAEAAGLTAEQREQIARKVTEWQAADNPSSGKAAFHESLLAMLNPEQRELLGPTAPMETLNAESSPQTEPATTLEQAPARTPAKMPVTRSMPNDGKLYFNFRYQPWKDVLDWFAEQANLSLTLDAAPEGTFNYADTRGYTPAEALDVLNSVLLTKGFTLVRHQRMLVLANISEGIPANLVPTISLSELDGRGQHELVSVLIPLQKMTAAEAETEIKKLLGPQGSIVTLPKAQQIQITETAGRLRTIRRVIEAVEGPTEVEGRLRQFTLQNITAEEALPVVRKLLNIPDETDAAADGSLRLATDLSGRMLLATGKEHRLAQLDEILKTIDVAEEGFIEEGPLETPQLEVYSVATSDPTAVLQVLQTLLAGQPDVRLALDPKTGNVIALARPSQHATIQATISQMQRDGRRIEAFPLRQVDPQAAVLAINKLFGIPAEGPVPPSAPTVDADPLSRTLLVRASEAQVEQIRTLLEKMGETGGDAGGDSALAETRGHVRVLPLTGRTARSAIDQIEQLWPTVRANKIRIVTPSSSGAIRGLPDFTTPSFAPTGRRPELPASRDREEPDFFPSEDGDEPDTEPKSAEPEASNRLPGGPHSSPVAKPVQPSPGDRSTSVSPRSASRVPARFASEQVPTSEAQSAPSTNADSPSDDALAGSANPPVDNADQPPAEIVVAPGPTGTVIISEDLEALDEFEALLTAMASRTASGREFAVFYLKHAKAAQVAETLRQIFGGGDSGGGDGGLMGDLAGAALGDLGGGLLGSLLGGGGGGGGSVSGTVGAVDIVPDTRLNALITRGKPADLDTLEQLLEILDQVDSPEEVLAAPKPRMIPVIYTSAEEIAGVVRQVYADRIAGATGGNQQRPSPQDFIRALRGGRDRGGSPGGSVEEPQKMSIGVDARSNSLIVSAPQALFTEVEALVRQLDQGGNTTGETTRVITLKRSNPQAVSQALASVLGPSVTSNTTNLSSTSGNNSNSRSRSGGSESRRSDRSRNSGADAAAEFQQRIEFMNRLRGQMGNSSGSRGSRGSRSFGGR